MEIEEFRKYTKNLDEFTAQEVSNMTLMSNEELEDYQYELEHDTGNLSTYDHIRVLYTMKKKIFEERDMNPLRNTKRFAEVNLKEYDKFILSAYTYLVGCYSEYDDDFLVLRDKYNNIMAFRNVNDKKGYILKDYK